MTRACFGCAVPIVMLLMGTADPAGQAPKSPAPQSFNATTTAILVDVVVRDRRGRPVTTLSAEDFEIAEDGVRQKVDSFTRVSHGGGIGVGVAWRTPSPPNPARDTSAPDPPAPPVEAATTAFVFDHLSSEALRLAQNAVSSYVPMSGDSNVRIGVFAAGPGVRVVQPYTTDRTLVRKAVARLMPSGSSAAERTAERSDTLRERRRELGDQDPSTAPGGGATVDVARTAAQRGQRETELRMVQTELNMIRSFDNLDRDFQGYDTSMALMSVVRSLAEWPGRKTIVLFSEGLPASPALSARLDSVIDAANRANVTTYAVDAHGLRTNSALATPRKELDALAEERLAQTASGGDRTEQPLTMSLERVSDTLTLDSRTGLARLATNTGGFLIDQSNDLSSAFRRIDEDNQFHYLLTYSPSNAALDGTFRAIRVKVGRPGMQVFARKGYRASRARPGAGAGSDEMAASALLDRAPLPNAFPMHASGFSFPDPVRPGLSPVLVHVSTRSLRFDVDAQRSTYSGRAAIVVRIKDGEGRDVQTLSQQYLLSGDAKDVEAAKNGTILFYREPDLPEGVYTMEAIVLDALSRRASARVSTLTVPAGDARAIGMSSLVLVSHAEEIPGPVAPDAATAGPLYVGRTLLYPNLGEPIRKSAAAELAFYFALYGDARGLKANVDLLRNGQLIASAPVELPAATGSRVQHVGRLPVDRLPNGTYELRIQVTGAGRELSRTAYFTLQD